MVKMQVAFYLSNHSIESQMPHQKFKNFTTNRVIFKHGYVNHTEIKYLILLLNQSNISFSLGIQTELVKRRSFVQQTVATLICMGILGILTKWFGDFDNLWPFQKISFYKLNKVFILGVFVPTIWSEIDKMENWQQINWTKVAWKLVKSLLVYELILLVDRASVEFLFRSFFSLLNLSGWHYVFQFW